MLSLFPRDVCFLGQLTSFLVFCCNPHSVLFQVRDPLIPAPSSPLIYSEDHCPLVPSSVDLPSSRLVIASIQQQGSGLPVSAPLFSRELWLRSAIVIIISILMTEIKNDEQPRPEATQLARHRLSLKLWLHCQACAHR